MTLRFTVGATTAKCCSSSERRVRALKSCISSAPPPTVRTARTHGKLKAGGYRLYSRKKDAQTGKRKNLGTFSSRAAAEKHERAVQYFKRA